ncbi:MAG: flagellar motor switch protein FliG [Treponema sp.]|nr:flagellar motor switch protein FliG [Treponema sp.]
MTKNDLVSQAYNQLNKKKESPEIKKPVFQKISLEKAQPAAGIQKTQASAGSQKAHTPANLQKAQTQANPKSDLSKSRLSGSQQLDNSVNYLKTGGLLKVPVEKSEAEGKDSVYRRVAKFLLIIGEDEAAKILPHLSEAQIEKIIPEIASIRSVDKDEAQVILAEFDSLLNEARQSGGLETAREMLTKAYGEKRANEMLSKAVAFEGKKPFEYLQGADSERIYLLIKDENIGVQSLVLSNLEPKLSASVINKMTAEEKKAIVLRLAKMESVSPDVIRRVDQAMHEKSLRQTTEKAENIDGRNALAQILKKMDPGSENDILSYLSEDDPDLGQDLRSRLFTMDDVVKSDDRFIQEKLRLMSEIDIAYLIAAKPDDFRDKILNNISAGRREDVLAQEDILKPMRRSDCEKITSEFFSKLRRAYEEGHLIIKDRNDDVFI